MAAEPIHSVAMLNCCCCLSLQVNLVEWLKRMVAERRVEEVLDPRLPEPPPSKALKRAVLAALRCVDPDGSQRPTMPHVVHMLEDDQILRDVRQNPCKA